MAPKDKKTAARGLQRSFWIRRAGVNRWRTVNHVGWGRWNDDGPGRVLILCCRSQFCAFAQLHLDVCFISESGHSKRRLLRAISGHLARAKSSWTMGQALKRREWRMSAFWSALKRGMAAFPAFAPRDCWHFFCVLRCVHQEISEKPRSTDRESDDDNKILSTDLRHFLWGLCHQYDARYCHRGRRELLSCACGCL